MLAVRAGVTDAFTRLFEAWRDPVWRFFRRRVRSPERAEELAQDVFTALLEAAPRYEPRGAFRSYLFGIAYNILLADRRRRHKDHEPLEHDVAATGSDPDAAILVQWALAQLEPDDREMVMLREYEQLSYQEIADLFGMPLNSVRSRLFRARGRMRETLTGGTGLPGPSAEQGT